MEDRGMTREERSSAKRSIETVALRCDQLRDSIRQLLGSLPANPERAGWAGEKWIQLADSIAYQLKNLGDGVADQLDHWVFEPIHPGKDNEPSKLPEYLRTKMTEEQEKKDRELRTERARPFSKHTLDELADRQTKTNESIKRIIDEIENSSAMDAIRTKRQRSTESLSALTRKPEQPNGLPLLRTWVQNDRKGVQTVVE